VPLALEQAEAGRSRQGPAGLPGRRAGCGGLVQQQGWSRDTGVFPHPCSCLTAWLCLAGACFPSTVPRFPSFLAQGGEMAMSAKHLECCWQVFLPRLTLLRKILSCSAGGRASRRLVVWDASLREAHPASFPFPCCHPRAVTRLLSCWLTDGFALKQMLPALSVQGHPIHPLQLPSVGRT